MVYRGHVHNGRIELDDQVSLPEGARVELTLVSESPSNDEDRPIEDVLAEIAARNPESEWEKLPADLSDQLDHYIYGTPKR